MTHCKRILLVDVNLQVLNDLSVRCQAIGLEVFTAQDAATTAELLESRKPDLICLDDQVAGSDGLSLSEMVLASPDDVFCPVIVLVSQSEAVSRTRSKEMCVYALHKRPNLWRYLEPVICELVDIQPIRRRSNDQEHGVSESTS